MLVEIDIFNKRIKYCMPKVGQNEGAGFMILVVLIAFFVIAGIAIKYFKQDWLITYYVKFTSEEKKTTDIKWIRNVFGTYVS